MEDTLDKAYDLVLFGSALVCFGAAIFFVLHGAFGHLSYYEARGDLWNAAILFGVGIVLSGFFFWIKSWADG